MTSARTTPSNHACGPPTPWCCWTSRSGAAPGALRRSRENLAFPRWLVTYRRRALPVVEAAITRPGPRARLHRLGNPGAAEEFLAAQALT
ncbi:hypothetical protein [Amycolatopsis sp. FDAARGOS 1241]|uniref:hypothetical protein n=1 Tax=Amycolatopsis sp. FDAARGOS 1241 TaxID=2778070 RepID=UPI00194EB490|nr:hypothetical protein [Amycolatopsis sp. FDAARGOS 1241]QRP43214.1 hypothetical protein I6J71_27765 [Amycolatopsis sp. FDAARGOS 1241]